MLNLIKRHHFLIIISVLVIFVGARLYIFVDPDNWSGGGDSLYAGIILLPSITFGVLAICLVTTVVGFLKKQKNTTLFALSWIIVSIINSTIDHRFYAVGSALLSVHQAGAKNVFFDALEIARRYPAITCIRTLPKRYPCENPLDPSVLPESIRELNPSSVIVEKEYILLEKIGLEGVYRGFIIFRDEFDPWLLEADVILQTECIDCWRIRIIDGMYWYHETSDFKINFLPPLTD